MCIHLIPFFFHCRGNVTAKEREREYCDYVLQRPTTTDFIKVTVKVSDEPTAKVISGVERSQLIGLMHSRNPDRY